MAGGGGFSIVGLGRAWALTVDVFARMARWVVDLAVSIDYLDVVLKVLNWLADKILGPAMVAGMFTVLFSVLMERHKATRDVATKIVDGLRDDVKAIQPVVVEYWSRSRKKGDPALEVKINSFQEDILSGLALLADEFDIQVFGSSAADQDAMAKLLDALTGGDFQTAGRAEDRERAQSASAALVDLRARLAKTRISNIATAPILKRKRGPASR